MNDDKILIGALRRLRDYLRRKGTARRANRITVDKRQRQAARRRAGGIGSCKRQTARAYRID